ncbi:hypothetical protein D1872_204470 [compost metagenome]
MPSIQETAYPRLKSSPTIKDLDKLFSPTSEEITWAKTKARSSFSQLGLMIMLKTFQCLLFCPHFGCSASHYNTYSESI